MKHIKLFTESLKKQPQIGDYVICKDISSNRINEWIKNRIGKIEEIIEESSFSFVVEYLENPSDNNENYSRRFNRKEILHFSPNKEDLEMYINANKYNL